MHLLILGATGGIGSALIAQATARGHRITAFVRSPQKLDPSSAGVTVVEGDPRDAPPLEKAMTGCDAVISSLGPPIPFTGRTTIMGDGAAATVRAMQAAGLRRLLLVSGDLQFPSGGPPWLVRVTLLRHLAKDQAELERVTRSSAVDWRWLAHVYGAVTVPWRLSIITGESRKSIGGGPPNLASTIALHSERDIGDDHDDLLLV